MRLRPDRDTLTSPLSLLGLTVVAFGAMALVVATEPGDAGAARPEVPVTQPAPTTTTTVPMAPDAPVTSTTVDVTPPVLQVAAGIDGATVPDAELTLTGTTEAGARVAVGFATAVADPSGAWSLAVSLAEGDNTLAVSATDDLGNQALVSVRVTYQPPVPITAVPTTLPAPTTATPAPPVPNRPRNTPTPAPTTAPAAPTPSATPIPAPTTPPAAPTPSAAPAPTVPVDVETGRD